MRAKTILTLILGAFVAIAFAVVAMQSRAPAGASLPAVAAVASMAPANPSIESPQAGVTEPALPPQTASREISGAAAPSTPAMESAAPKAPSAIEVPPAPPARERKVVATYFHGQVRCATCRKVEAYAREAVEEGFASQIAAGTVEFRAVNVEEPENRHFVDDYQLMTRSVVVTEEVDGAVAQWVRLDQVWSLVGDRPRYVDYVQDAVHGYLGTR